MTSNGLACDHLLRQSFIMGRFSLLCSLPRLASLLGKNNKNNIHAMAKGPPFLYRHSHCLRLLKERAATPGTKNVLLPTPSKPPLHVLCATCDTRCFFSPPDDARPTDRRRTHRACLLACPLPFPPIR